MYGSRPIRPLYALLRSNQKCVFARLAEKKATIGYTYEDSTVEEPEPTSDKEEENSEEEESEEDEGIPDIGQEVPLNPFGVEREQRDLWLLFGCVVRLCH